ncbi:MAG: hypothetical protein ACI8QC_003857 [Planctomycetota bacterium]|jgi:hypothetical protein
MDESRDAIERAFERDRAQRSAWQLLARWAEAAERPGERLRALHEDLRLAVAQGAKRTEIRALREFLAELDPSSKALFEIAEDFRGRLTSLAQRYEKQQRWHGALRVWKQVLALVPDDQVAIDGIDRVTSQPDPSLAADAKSKDLLEGITAEWIAEHDAEHSEWKQAGRMEREHYITKTDAGYEVLVRVAEAMEQANGFYREFFEYGGVEDGRTVPRINVLIFKNREEYLKLGSSPAEWSGGQFTGSAVETYVPAGGFEAMLGVLFHEAAHQFVSLATSAVGWLNEGLASFFEGTRILANGSVIMNLPADHRLFPLATRMEAGWMTEDDLDAMEGTEAPASAPPFDMVLQNRYSWGPPWYAPTWGVVFFLYNYQDPWDGRFVYRKAFRVFIDKSGGRMGDSAVRNFEEVVLANPEPAFDAKPPKDAVRTRLPKTVAALNDVWKAWILDLRDRQAGELGEGLPYLRWARLAQEAGRHDWATEHYTKGLLDEPHSTELMMGFGGLLADSPDTHDRAGSLFQSALAIFERADPPDALAIAKVERLLNKLDPNKKNLTSVMDKLREEAISLVGAYKDVDQDEMVLDLSWRFGSAFRAPELLEEYAAAVRRRGSGLERWELAYNEDDLDGWSAGNGVFKPDGNKLLGRFGKVQPQNFDFSFLTLDRVTSGDYTIEADVQVKKGKSSYAGFVFGQKGSSTFHGVLVFPDRDVTGVSNSGYVDLMTSRGAGATQAWRHVPVKIAQPKGSTSAGNWHKLRLDVIGKQVDVWFDGELVATHAFGSSSTLRGRFGLVVGRGESEFRRVRFQLRDPRDPAASIEREIRLAEASLAGGGAIAGSYQGSVPPFPKIGTWAQGERTSWKDGVPGPQLVVYMSRRQNELVPVDAWLRDLAARGHRFGLQIMVVMPVEDGGGMESFLGEYPLPGSVGSDSRLTPDSQGASFEAAFIKRFNLPRLWLLDLDGTVVWEGDPGFAAGAPSMAPYPSYVDDPLQALVAKRRMAERVDWRDDWKTFGREALESGDLELALPLLIVASSFTPALEEDLDRAARIYNLLVSNFDNLDEVGLILEERSAEAAVSSLLEWARLFGTSRKVVSKALKGPIKSKNAKAWDGFMSRAAKFPPKRGNPMKVITGLIESLQAMSAPWVPDLIEELEVAALGEDWESAKGILEAAGNAPKAWLCVELFGF